MTWTNEEERKLCEEAMINNCSEVDALKNKVLDMRITTGVMTETLARNMKQQKLSPNDKIVNCPASPKAVKVMGNWGAEKRQRYGELIEKENMPLDEAFYCVEYYEGVLG